MTAWVISDSAERTSVNDSSYSHLKKKKKGKEEAHFDGRKGENSFMP